MGNVDCVLCGQECNINDALFISSENMPPDIDPNNIAICGYCQEHIETTFGPTGLEADTVD